MKDHNPQYPPATDSQPQPSPNYISADEAEILVNRAYVDGHDAGRRQVIGSPAYRLPELKQAQDAFAENFCEEFGIPYAYADKIALAWLMGRQSGQLTATAKVFADLRSGVQR